MRKAVFYARVSTALQERERTIESQIAELKKQINDAGNVLIEEYIDDGFSGSQLDRPAMNKLREDIKTDQFDTIYFLNADRIAREVAYQTIIIAEILKYKKQIIINGKDYVHNPENKFALTVLGAVSELEKAKMVERSLRGKLHKLKQGYVLNNGENYGYTYIKRTSETPGKLIINEKEAKIVRHIYEEYAKGVSWGKLIRNLEEMGAERKSGLKMWNTLQLANILKNETYAGIKYFNKSFHFKKTDNPLHKIKYGKRVYKERSEWIGVKVPAIVSRALFEKAQKRIEKNRKQYQRPGETKLLSGLIKCGRCGRRFIAYQRFFRYKIDGTDKERIYHKVAYVCGRRAKNVMHAKIPEKELCKNPEISSRLIEPQVMRMIEETLLEPKKLFECTNFAENKSSETIKILEKKVGLIEKRLLSLNKEKRRMLDLYATGEINRRKYAENCSKLDKNMEKMKTEKEELLKSIPALHKKYIIVLSIKQFCEVAKAKFKQSIEFEAKRQFLLDYIGWIEFDNKKLSLNGEIPITLNTYQDPDQPSEASKIKFCINDKI